jgi:predicted phage terminase large subunit-like protein
MPAPLGGGLVKAAWFRHYAAEERLPFERVVQSWDTASKATELSDFSVCTSSGIHGKNVYLLDVLRRRMEYPELKRAVVEQYERFRPSVVLIEDKASGTQLIQELIAGGLHAVTRYQPQFDKVMRMHAQTAMIENGFVHLPDAAPWLAQYLHEVTSFPNGRHDDQLDSTAQMLDWFKRGSGPSSNAGIFRIVSAAGRRSAQTSRPGGRPGCGCAFLPASAESTCTASTSQPTARSRRRRARPNRFCGGLGEGRRGRAAGLGSSDLI